MSHAAKVSPAHFTAHVQSKLPLKFFLGNGRSDGIGKVILDTSFSLILASRNKCIATSNKCLTSSNNVCY